MTPASEHMKRQVNLSTPSERSELAVILNLYWLLPYMKCTKSVQKLLNNEWLKNVQGTHYNVALERFKKPMATRPTFLDIAHCF